MRSGIPDLNNERRSEKTMGARTSRNELRDVKRCYEMLIAKMLIFAKQGRLVCPHLFWMIRRFAAGEGLRVTVLNSKANERSYSQL